MLVTVRELLPQWVVPERTSHVLFKISFNLGADPVVYRVRCGPYSAKRVNASIKSDCAGVPNVSGKVVLT